MKIKNKLLNHIMINGEKKTSEKILLKSIKELQRVSNKQSNNLIKLAILNTTPLFKLHKIINSKKQKKKNKKIREIPTFIANKLSRTSLAIKFILSSIDSKKSNNFYTNLKQEILATAQSKGTAIELKDNLQKQVLLKKRFFTYYRWK